MATKQKNQETIEYLLNTINKAVKEKYATNFASYYGGWNMYLNDNYGNPGPLGFDLRKSSVEMIAYLRGILKGLNYNK